MMENQAINDRQHDFERKGEKSMTQTSDSIKEMIVYGRHFMTKPPIIFYSQEKKMIINILWSGISIQSVPNNSQTLELIKYKDIISVHLSQDKDNEIIIIYNNRLVAPGKNPQTQYNFKSDDRHLFFSDYQRGQDSFYYYNNIKQISGGVALNFASITASYIVDKSTKSYFEARLICFNSHLMIEIVNPLNLSDKKFEKLRKNMFYTNSKSHSTSLKAQQLNEIDQGNQSEGNKQNKQQQVSSSGNKCQIKGYSNPTTIIIKYRDIVRIQKKSNGFQINLAKPSLSLAFYLNDLNQVSGFINRIQKNSKESTKLEVSVTSTLQEEIHNIVKFNEKDMEVDFAIYAGRIMPSKDLKRYCILAIGKSGIFEVDSNDAEVYEQYDLKHLKDIVRQEQTGTVRNTLKLIFFNGQEVEYVFEPYQRDLFIVEILTNINMYYDNQSPCRRCLDMIHSRTPNYQLEINGWRIEAGNPERDQDVDNELMRNIIYAKGEDAFFSALREFNVNCNLKKTADADLNVYRQLITVLARYLQYFDDHDLLFFLKHIKIVKTIPSHHSLSIIEKLSSPICHNKQSEGAEQFATTSIQSSTFIKKQRRNSQDSMVQHENDHYEKLLNLERDAIHKFIDEEYSTHHEHRKKGDDMMQTKDDDEFLDNILNDDDDIFEYEQTPMTKKNQNIQKALISSQTNIVNPFGTTNNNNAQSPGLYYDHQKEGQLSLSQRQRYELESTDYINLKLNECNKDLKKLFQLCSHLEYTWQEQELMHQMRSKSVILLKKLTKTQITLANDASSNLQLNSESVEALTLKVEEMLKCLTIFQNCKRFFEDKTIKQERFKEFKSILQLLTNPDPLIVYQTSQLFKRVGFYHNNMMQKAETENKNFLLDARFNILDRVFYQISNYTLIKRPLSQYTFMVRIYSCLSIINTLFQARIESTSSIHRQAIIYHLQSPVFFAVFNRILRYNSFSLIVNSINLMNALYYFSTENKQFINMILLNSTILLFLLHLVIQDLYSSKQLKEISFNLLFSLLNQRSQACYVIMNVFPKPLFKMQKTESLFVDQWTKQEWYNFFFLEVQKDIKLPHYFWLKLNLKTLSEIILKEDKSFLQQQIYTVFKRINHVCDLQEFFPYLFRKDGIFDKVMDNPLTTSTSSIINSSIRGNPQEVAQQNISPQETELFNSIKELQKEIFAKLYWNIDDFKVEYNNVIDQFLCGRYYLKQLIINNKRLQFDFVDSKNQIMEKEIKELWENLVSSLMNQQTKDKQALVIRMMTILYKEYSRVLKVTNIVPYLVHILNLHEFHVVQYSLIQLVLTVLNSDDSQAKQFHCRTLIDCDGIQQLINVICQRISLQEDGSEVQYGSDATILKLPEVRQRGDENLYCIFMCLKMINGCIQMHSHIFRKRDVFPLTKPQKVCFEKRNWRIMQNILLLRNDSSPQEISPQSIVRNEYLKLIYEYLLNDHMLHINGFCEFLVDQLNENTMKLTFTIMKALFYRLTDCKVILEEIINGQGLQNNHIQVFPFFKFFPIQLMLILLNQKNQDDFQLRLANDPSFTTSGITINHNSVQSQQQSTSSQQVNISKDDNVDQTCNSYKSDNQERYDLIWNKNMRMLLKDKLNIFLLSYRERVNEFYINNFKPGKLKMTDYKIVNDEKINSYPVMSESFSETIYYPQLKNEISSCQIYLRLWAKFKNDDIENFDLPTKFAEKTILKIQQYSFNIDIFKVLNDKTSSSMKNLLHLLKANSKIYKNRQLVNIIYPYNDILSILQSCTKIVKDSTEDPSKLEDLDESALEETQAPQSPLLSQNKRSNSAAHKNSISDNVPSSPSRSSLFQPRKLSISSRSSSVSNIIDISFSNPLVDCLQTTFNQYIKAALKVIFYSIRERKNLEAFTQKSTGIECLLYTLSNIVMQIQIKNINRSDLRNYFDDLSVSYSEIKILNYSILILQEINDSQKVKLNQISQQKRNNLCLLIQRIQKITTTYFHTFLEKFTGNLNSNIKEKYGNSLLPPQKQKSNKGDSKQQQSSPSPVLVNSHSTTSLLSVTNSLSASQIIPANAPSPQYNNLLDKLFNVDTDNILTYSSVVVEKFFKACRKLNLTLSYFTISLSKNVYFLESLIRGGCVWRAIEIILSKGKPFNTHQNNEKKNNIANIDEITIDYAKMVQFIIENCEFIKKFENGTQQLSLQLKPVQINNNNQAQQKENNDISFSSSINNHESEEKKQFNKDREEIEVKKQINNQSSIQKGQQNNDSHFSLNETPQQKNKPHWRNNFGIDSDISEEDQSRSDERSSVCQSQKAYNFSTYSKMNETTNIREGIQEDGEDQENASPSKRKQNDDEKKEYIFYGMQLLREIGPLGRDKLIFFINQFLIALTRNVDNHLLKYLKDHKFDQFTRKINSNIELPDFIWNQISRDKLDQNLKLQLINVNNSLGKIFIDKLLEHQGIIQLEEHHQPGCSSTFKDIHHQNEHDTSPINTQSELQICGIYLRIFNDSDNFEITNPQTFSQEIFNQLKQNVEKIQTILQNQAPNRAYDALAINLPFPTEIKAVKECIKAILSLLTRYSVSYIVLNPENISTLFAVLKVEMDYQVNLSAFKLQIVKILHELAGSVQGGKALMSSKICIKYIIYNLMDCSTISTPIITQFLSTIQKLARMKDNLESMVRERIVAILLLNMLKKEYLKQAIRVQIVEVINEINTDNSLFINYVSEKFPPRIIQKCFEDKQQKPSVEIIEIFESVSVTSDLLWTNLMRIEAIMVLEQEIVNYMKNQDENIKSIIPQYPEYKNEVQCSQVLLRIFNLIPSFTKFTELPYLSQNYSKSDGDSYTSYSEVLLDNLISLTEQTKNQFIKLQEENILKNKEYNANNVIDVNQLNNSPNEDPSLYEFDRVSISYITTLTSLMFCIEQIIIHEKKQIKEKYFKGICSQFSILSENKSHSHLKSTVLQIAYLLKDQQNIHNIFAQNNLYFHITQALNYSLDSPQEQDCLTFIEQTIILNLLIKLIRDKENPDRKLTIEHNKNFCLPAISRLLESIDEDNSFIKSYIIGYSAEMLKSGFFFEEISAIIDLTTFSSKQLTASKNIHCEWVNLWRTCIINYDETNSLSEQQQRLFQDKYCELFFSLPIQSEFSIQTLPFPPQDYLIRQQQVEDFKQVYEKENYLKKNVSIVMTESVHQQFS